MTFNSHQNETVEGKVSSRWSLHVFFVVDCSGSMVGDKMASLNYAMRSALPALRAAAADHDAITTFVRVIRFADHAAWINDTNDPVDRFEWRELSADGETSLGEALKTLASVMTAEAMPGPQLPPVIVLLSDGLPTDDVNAGVALLEASAHGGKAMRIAVAIGSDADTPTLTQFMGTSTLRPLRANNVETLVSSIRWAASEPVSVVAQIARGDGVSLAALNETLSSSVAQQTVFDKNFVW